MKATFTDDFSWSPGRSSSLRVFLSLLTSCDTSSATKMRALLAPYGLSLRALGPLLSTYSLSPQCKNLQKMGLGVLVGSYFTA